MENNITDTHIEKKRKTHKQVTEAPLIAVPIEHRERANIEIQMYIYNCAPCTIQLARSTRRSICTAIRGASTWRSIGTAIRGASVICFSVRLSVSLFFATPRADP